uniref:Ig-like domain-containing protein n=1 Tax=Anaerococcus octavius TaxID=54007 RepID=UPI0027BA6115
MDNKFKRIIEYKKQKGSIRKPKYATRKLSIGLVSCMLGYALLVSPSSVEAAELDSENQAVAEDSAEPETTSDEDNLVEENEENKEDLSEDLSEGNKEETSAPVEEEKPETTEAPKETEKTEEASNSEEDTVFEDDTVVEEKEAFALTDAQRQALKEADFTDSEIAGIEEEIANKLEADSSLDAQTLVDEKISGKAATPEMDEEDETTSEEGEKKPEAASYAASYTDATPQPEGVEEKDVEEKEEGAITDVNIEIKGANKGNTEKGIPDKSNASLIKPLGDNKKNPNEDMVLQSELNFNVPSTTKSGDKFIVKISDNVNLHGVSKTKSIPDLKHNGKTVATAEVQPDGRTVIYTFNDNINGLEDIKMKVAMPLYIDKKGVPNNSESENITVNVEGKEGSKNYKVDYTLQDHAKSDTGFTTLSGVSDIDQTAQQGEDHNTYRHTIHVNPAAQRITGSNVVIENLPGSENAIIFDDDVMNSVKVYRVNDPKALNRSFYLDEDQIGYGLTDVTANTKRYWEPYVDANGNKLTRLGININQGWSNNPYIIRYIGKRLPDKNAKSRTYFSVDGKVQPNGYSYGPLRNNWTWDNTVEFYTGESEISGREKQGKVIVHYIDEEDNIIKDYAIDTPLSKYGTEYDTSDDNKPETIDFEGKTYKFVKVKDGDKETGTIAQPITEVTYIYKVEKGSVTVKYITEDGEVLE